MKRAIYVYNVGGERRGIYVTLIRYNRVNNRRTKLGVEFRAVVFGLVIWQKGEYVNGESNVCLSEWSARRMSEAAAAASKTDGRTDERAGGIPIEQPSR